MKKNRAAKLFFVLFGFCVLALASGGAAYVEAKEYGLNPENTKIGFHLDSTLHVVHGIAHEFQGKVGIPEDLDPKKYSTEIMVSVKDMETANNERDEKMHNTCFEVAKNPEIRFRSTEFKDFPSHPEKGKDFEFSLEGDLTIKGVTNHVAIPVKVQSKEEGFLFKGSVWLNYLQDFNIKDPSVFIFRVAKKVEVFLEVNIPFKTFENQGIVSQ